MQRIPHLSDCSVGLSTFLSLRTRRLPGFTGPIPSATLDKVVFSFYCTILFPTTPFVNHPADIFPANMTPGSLIFGLTNEFTHKTHKIGYTGLQIPLNNGEPI